MISVLGEMTYSALRLSSSWPPREKRGERRNTEKAWLSQVVMRAHRNACTDLFFD